MRRGWVTSDFGLSPSANVDLVAVRGFHETRRIWGRVLRLLAQILLCQAHAARERSRIEGIKVRTPTLLKNAPDLLFPRSLLPIV